MRDEYEFFVDWRPERMAYIGHLMKVGSDGSRFSIKMLLTKVKRGGLIELDDAFLPAMDRGEMERFLQVIVDEAAKIGVVANNARTEAIAAGRHLEDMRRIAFHKLGIEPQVK